MGCSDSKAAQTENSTTEKPREKTDEPKKEEDKPQDAQETNEEPTKEEQTPQEPEPEEKDWLTEEEAEGMVVIELGVTKEEAHDFVESCEHNGDGLVSHKELKELRDKIKEYRLEMETLFKEKDTEDKGYVSTEEALELLKSRFPGFEEDTLKSLVSEYDKDKNDQIQYKEFIKFYSHLKARKEHMLKRFEELDKDESGKLDRSELVPVLRKECCLATYQAESFFLIYAGKDRKIDIEEFREMCEKMF